MNLIALKTKFPEHASMSTTAFFNFMHKEYYSDMSRAQMYRAIQRLAEKKKEVVPEPKKAIDNKDRAALAKLGYTGKDTEKMSFGQATQVIEEKVAKSQEVIKAEKQEKAIEELKTVSAKTLEQVKALTRNPPKTTDMKSDHELHTKIDTLVQQITAIVPAKKWEFNIIRDMDGNMDRIIATEVA